MLYHSLDNKSLIDECNVKMGRLATNLTDSEAFLMSDAFMMLPETAKQSVRVLIGKQRRAMISVIHMLDKVTEPVVRRPMPRKPRNVESVNVVKKQAAERAEKAHDEEYW